MPILIERYGLREGSAGAGRFRGGHGVDIAARVLAQDATVTGRNIDRFRFRPWGRDGGEPGTLGAAWIKRADGRREDIGRLDVVRLQRDDVLHLSSQGGGGFGSPLERDPALVLDDVRNGLFALARARESYGVIAGVDGGLDVDATRKLRVELAEGRPAAGRFTFGPEREAHEAAYPDELRRALVRLVLPLPPGPRQRVWNLGMTRILERARAGESTSPESLPALLGISPEPLPPVQARVQATGTPPL
jgi:N-methylhydantoinase B